MIRKRARPSLPLRGWAPPPTHTVPTIHVWRKSGDGGGFTQAEAPGRELCRLSGRSDVAWCPEPVEDPLGPLSGASGRPGGLTWPPMHLRCFLGHLGYRHGVATFAFRRGGPVATARVCPPSRTLRCRALPTCSRPCHCAPLFCKLREIR